MRRADLLLLSALLVAVALGARPARRQARAADRATAAPALASAVQPPGKYLGAGSCAAASCHGGGRALTTAGNEYAIWCQEDRHARAFETLRTERSRAMAGRLGLASATDSALCTNCHGPVIPSGWLAAGNQHSADDGVTCEVCHGPAERWIEPHKRTAGPGRWATYAAAQREALGFLNTKDLARRARLCAGCHVGSPGRDVNHDLIAAGHPRLTWEFSAYQNLMPAHWDPREERQRVPAHDARLWLVGQVVSARTALALLAWRAGAELADGQSRADWSPIAPVEPPAAWPELAEYACFRCHHDLAHPGWRLERAPAAGRGNPAWGTWHFSALEGVGSQVAPRDEEARALLARLRRDMSSLGTPPARVAQIAADLHKLLGVWEAGALAIELSPARLVQLEDSVARAAPPDDWEEFVQAYLALASIGRARLVMPGAPQHPASRTEALRAMRDSLALPEGHDSPGNVDAAAIAELLRHLQALRHDGHQKP